MVQWVDNLLRRARWVEWTVATTAAACAAWVAAHLLLRVVDGRRQREIADVASEERQHEYALLTTGGLESILVRTLVAEQGVCPPAVRVHVPPPPQLPPGFSAGAAGGASPVLLSCTSPLPEAALSSSCVSAALALVLYLEISPAELEDPDAVAAVFKRSTHGWDGALKTWSHHARGGARCSDVSFRVATLRCGARHAFSSKALDGALGAAVGARHPTWRVDLRSPDLLIVCTLVHRQLSVGLLLPPFRPRAADVLPIEPRPFPLCGTERPHTRPSRAAALVRLAAVRDGEAFLDPCGGIGILSLEAATCAAVDAISVDLDGEACHAAETNVAAAQSAKAHDPFPVRIPPRSRAAY